jgi:CHAT domain-containing protein/tetratricopeptide (TPR) repeat protein
MTELPGSRRIVDLLALTERDAVLQLEEAGWWTPAAGQRLAEWALDAVEANPLQAAQALALGQAIARAFGQPAQLGGWLAYAAARLAVVQGDLVAAEVDLRRASAQWQAAQPELVVRSALGLTQVLAMQGKLPGAEVTARQAVELLTPNTDSVAVDHWLLARALRNLATVYVMQERHLLARDTYLRALDELSRFAAQIAADTGPGAGADLDEDAVAAAQALHVEIAHVALNLASAHTFLDAPDAADTALREAEARFEAVGDRLNCGRTRTNLGRLALRRGDYGAALDYFDRATLDLLGDEADDGPDEDLARLRQADELLLEHALAYVALNLLPEADRALHRAEALFRQIDQPYELAQTRYTQGLLLLRQEDLSGAGRALDEALVLYRRLDNPLWRNRTRTAQAYLAVAASDPEQASLILAELLGDMTPTTPTGAVAWDRIGLIEIWLLRLHVALSLGAVAEAQQAASAVEVILGVSADPTYTTPPPLPNLSLRLLHARGRIAAAQGDATQARAYFAAAVDLLDVQRAALPMEEVRTAYLDDKTAYYADLVISLLDAPLPTDNVVAAAFAVVERARSRALLERLMGSVTLDDGAEGERVENAESVSQRETLRRRLHWLYNRLLSDALPSDDSQVDHRLGDDANRHAVGRLGEEVVAQEAALQRLEWRAAPHLAYAEPVGIDDLQQVLADDQQAVVYYVADDEVMAFVVDATTQVVVRGLASYAAVQHAQTELRFQLGRAELGADYVGRNAPRLYAGVQRALGELYRLVIAPLAGYLYAPRQLVVPFGTLHLLPFHALWDGTHYWLEQVEVSYVPSASVAVLLRRETAAHGPLDYAQRGDAPVRFAGFAPDDARIPQAQAEIDAAAACFVAAATYHGAAASLAQLRAAAAEADVLHLATHGLFRPDNSFFSAIKLADGWLDVRTLYRMQLRSRLVVLSACESGMGQVRGGDEVVGLVRGFLAAGAHQVVATLWNVHDLSAAGLMQDFYRHLAQSPAAALRAAQLGAIAHGQHPYFWASFFAIG